jgi:PKD repeat protein
MHGKKNKWLLLIILTLVFIIYPPALSESSLVKVKNDSEYAYIRSSSFTDSFQSLGVSGVVRILDPKDSFHKVGYVDVTFFILNTGDPVEFKQGDTSNRIEVDLIFVNKGSARVLWSTIDNGLSLKFNQSYKGTVHYKYEGDKSEEVLIRIAHYKYDPNQRVFRIGEFGLHEVRGVLEGVSPKLDLTYVFPDVIYSGDTFSVTVTVRNIGTADATNVASGISWGGDAFSSLGCTGTWKKDRLAPGEAMQYTCSLKAGKPGTYTVEVSAVADSGVTAKSTIQVVVLEAKDTTPPSVKVLAPAGGESLTPGSTYRIKWQATDNVAVAKITIYLYKASGLTSVIASNIQNTGYYDWTVPDNPGSYYIRIVAVDTSGNTGTADSPQFVIAQIQQKQPPTLALNNPQINGLTVTISGTATPGYTGATITRIHWEWGDGKSEDTWLPATHTYTTPGTYTVTVTAYQSDGLTTAKTITVTLQATNKPPVADFSYTPSNPVAGDSVSFTDNSYDPDGSIVSWLWDFGDGTTSYERNPKHVFSSPGTYTVVLTVRDHEGAEKSTSKTIYVGNKVESKPIPLHSDVFPLVVVIQLVVIIILTVFIVSGRRKIEESERKEHEKPLEDMGRLREDYSKGGITFEDLVRRVWAIVGPNIENVARSIDSFREWLEQNVYGNRDVSGFEALAQLKEKVEGPLMSLESYFGDVERYREIRRDVSIWVEKLKNKGREKLTKEELVKLMERAKIWEVDCENLHYEWARKCVNASSAT